MAQLTVLQTAIKDALLKFKSKQTPYQDSILVKEIRSACSITNKKDSSIRVQDLEAAVQDLTNQNLLHISIHLDKVNNLLIKNVEQTSFLNPEDKKNRLRSEKSMTLLTDNDINQSKKQPVKKHNKPKKPRFDTDYDYPI